jgi:hypothetical protein
MLDSADFNRSFLQRYVLYSGTSPKREIFMRFRLSCAASAGLPSSLIPCPGRSKPLPSPARVATACVGICPASHRSSRSWGRKPLEQRRTEPVQMRMPRTTMPCMRFSSVFLRAGSLPLTEIPARLNLLHLRSSKRRDGLPAHPAFVFPHELAPSCRPMRRCPSA